MKYSRSELQRVVRLERVQLQQELTGLSRQAREISDRIRQIEDRLLELDKAEDLLEGYDH